MNLIFGRVLISKFYQCKKASKKYLKNKTNCIIVKRTYDNPPADNLPRDDNLLTRQFFLIWVLGFIQIIHFTFWYFSFLTVRSNTRISKTTIWKPCWNSNFEQISKFIDHCKGKLWREIQIFFLKWSKINFLTNKFVQTM